MTDEKLSNLHDALAKELLDKIKSGEASASLIKEAREFLKDNDIYSMPTDGNPLGKLKDQIPEFEDDDSDLGLPN